MDDGIRKIELAIGWLGLLIIGSVLLIAHAKKSRVMSGISLMMSIYGMALFSDVLGPAPKNERWYIEQDDILMEWWFRIQIVGILWIVTTIISCWELIRIQQKTHACEPTGTST